MMVKLLAPLDSFVGWLNSCRIVRFIVQLTPGWIKILLGVTLIFLSMPIWLPVGVVICFVQSLAEFCYCIYFYVASAWERSK